MQFFLTQFSRILGSEPGPSTVNFSALIVLIFLAAILITGNESRRYIE
jgi:hypothetical protein